MAILIATCILPFALLSRSIKKKKKELLKSVAAIATQFNSTIKKCDFGGQFAIALDESTNFVFFAKRAKDEIISQHVNLKEIKDCKPVNTIITTKVNNGYDKEIDRLELQFLSNTKKNSDTLLELYNSDQNVLLSGELQIMEKWSKIINEQLTILKHK